MDIVFVHWWTKKDYIILVTFRSFVAILFLHKYFSTYFGFLLLARSTDFKGLTAVLMSSYRTKPG